MANQTINAKPLVVLDPHSVPGLTASVDGNRRPGGKTATTAAFPSIHETMAGTPQQTPGRGSVGLGAASIASPIHPVGSPPVGGPGRVSVRTPDPVAVVPRPASRPVARAGGSTLPMGPGANPQGADAQHAVLDCPTIEAFPAPAAALVASAEDEVAAPKSEPIPLLRTNVTQPIPLLRATNLGSASKMPYQAQQPRIVEVSSKGNFAVPRPAPRESPRIMEVQSPAPKVEVLLGATNTTLPRRDFPQNSMFGTRAEPGFRANSLDATAPVEQRRSRSSSHGFEEDTVEQALGAPKSKVLHWTFTGLLAAATVALFVEQIMSAAQ